MLLPIGVKPPPIEGPAEDIGELTGGITALFAGWKLVGAGTGIGLNPDTGGGAKPLCDGDDTGAGVKDG